MTDVARVATAVAVRSGDPLPAIGDKAGLAAALEAADEIHFPDPALATAGIHFAKVMRDLGVWDRVAGRLKLAPNGNTAMRALAASTAPHVRSAARRRRKSAPRPASCWSDPCRRAAISRRSTPPP